VTYAGDLTASAAFELVRDNPDAVLVDVRTTAEWAHVGVPDLSELGKVVVFLEWQQGPQRSLNPAFVDELKQAVPPDVPVVMICRSGVRSVAAAHAATAAGLGPAYNVLEGFEGAGGWQRNGLPWGQQ
jgi:rhodanese-related sulfurtransferase